MTIRRLVLAAIAGVALTVGAIGNSGAGIDQDDLVAARLYFPDGIDGTRTSKPTGAVVSTVDPPTFGFDLAV
jgi:hypothetical protein